YALHNGQRRRREMFIAPMTAVLARSEFQSKIALIISTISKPKSQENAQNHLQSNPPLGRLRATPCGWLVSPTW
ncbi:MAG: hypothetical protein ACE5IY_18145, partial [bacterium]